MRWVLVFALGLLACGGEEIAAADVDSGLGTDECPIVDGGCDPPCSKASVQPIDVGGECMEPERTVACGRNMAGIGFACAARIDGSGIAGTYVGDLVEPYYKGWRGCTTDELVIFGHAKFHPCP